MNKRAAPAAPNSRQMFALRCRLIEPARPIGHGGPRNALHIDRLGPAGPRPCQVETLVGWPRVAFAVAQLAAAPSRRQPLTVRGPDRVVKLAAAPSRRQHSASRRDNRLAFYATILCSRGAHVLTWKVLLSQFLEM